MAWGRKAKNNSSQAAPVAPEAERLERKIALSRWVLLFEQLWPKLWLPIGVAGFFVFVSLAGLWEILSADLHRLIFGSFVVTFLAAFLPLLRIKWPSRDSALRRIERNSGIPHRPATSYEDQLSSDTNAVSSTIWAAHKKRLSALLARLKVGEPRPRVDRHDPFALRGLLMIGIVALLAITGSSAPDRLRSAFISTAPGLDVLSVRIDAWVTPPAYTERAPIMLNDGAKTIRSDGHRATLVEVPERSEMIVRIVGKSGALFNVDIAKGAGKIERVKFRSVNEAGDLAEFRISIDETMTVKLSKGGREAFSWNFNVIADENPEISLVHKPRLSVRGSLKLKYRASDDYGVASAEAIFELAEDTAADNAADGTGPDGDRSKARAQARKTDPYRAIFDDPLRFRLKLAKKNAKKTEGKTFKEVSSHPWAGLRVRLVLAAYDQAKQVGRSEPNEFILPQRKFTKPMARAIIEQRRNLVRNPRAHGRVADAIDALTLAPERFIPDRVVYLALRSAYWRLQNRPSPENVRSVFDQLWDVALRIEDGDLSGAEQALRAAQEKLMRALQENASSEELKELMKELRQALSRFLQSMARKQAENGAQPQNGKGPNKLLTAKDLDRMMKNIEKMLRSGSRDSAQQMLSQLQELLEQMQTGRSMAGSKGSQQMMRSAQELGELIGKQQKLLDDTFQQQRGNGRQGRQGQRGRRAQQGGRGQSGQGQGGQGQQGRQGQNGQQGQAGGQGGAGKGLSQRQSDLRGALNRLLEGMRGMGVQPPKELPGAGRAMGDAERALGGGELGQATRQQSLALDRLRRGTQSLVEQALKGMARRFGRTGADPLGRAQKAQGPNLGTSVRIPEEIDIQKAREILEELRRRLSDPSRPPVELDYIERLLRRF